MLRISWPEYALRLAMVAAERSEDPHMKVGACVLRHDNTVAGMGYNGAPPGVNIDWSDREERRKRVVHAEINALRYTNPKECWLLACNLLPCGECIKIIAAYGIKKIIFNDVYTRDKLALTLAEEYGVGIFASDYALKHMRKEDAQYVKRLDNI